MGKDTRRSFGREGGKEGGREHTYLQLTFKIETVITPSPRDRVSQGKDKFGARIVFFD